MSDPVQFSTELDVAPGGSVDKLVRVDLTAAAALDLPGIKASVEGIGLGVVLGIDLARAGQLGFIDFTVVFVPPTGMSAELDLPLVSGGGYLALTDTELRGVITANMGFVRVTGFGILGRQEFSLLVLLAAEFEPGIQLSFGFTLVGVGGLIGINRRADTNQLSAAVSSGDLSRLLFPRDPVAEAGHLLDVLSNCFPYASGGVVIGPMFKLGWGTPTIIAATLGVIVDTSGGRVIIVGRVAVTLPIEDAALIRIEALVLGWADGTGIGIDGSLANSNIVGMPIQGDIRIRLLTAPRGLFAISAGGFHPAFTPPEGMGGMRRLSMDLSPSPILSIRFEAYFALTSSAVMFGARIDITAGIDGFGIRGSATFDALITWEPAFGFDARLTASVSIECADFDVASIDLFAELSGVAPWRIRGHASFSILWWDVDIDVPDITWGPQPANVPPARDPLQVLVEAIGRPENWTKATASIPSLAMLRPGAADDEAAVHPLAPFELRQSTIPIDTELQRVDGVRLPQPVTLHVDLDGGAPAVVREQFAPSRFFDVDAATQIGSAGFVDLPGGFDFGVAGVVAPDPRSRRSTYEQKVLMNEAPWLTTVLVDFGLLAGAHAARPSTAVVAPHRPVAFREPYAVVVGTANLQDATGAFAAALGAGGNAAAAGVIGASFAASAGSAATSGPVAQHLVQRLATADPPAAAAFQVAAAWEVDAA